MAPPRARHPLVAPWLGLAVLLLAATTPRAQDEPATLAEEEANLSDEAKLAALEEAAATKAAEEDEARLLAEEQETKFLAEEAKMKALEEDAKRQHEEKEALRLAKEDEEAKLKAAADHVKALEEEATKNALDEEKARKDVAAEEATFKAEQAKFKALEEQAEHKAAEREAIEAEEARLIAKMNAENAGDDMTAPVSKTASTGKSVQHAAAAEVPVAPGGNGNIYDKLARAKAAGVDAKDFAAVASKAQKLASDELKQAANDHLNTRRLQAAFANAEKAGVPAAEQAASKAGVVDSAAKRLAKAHTSGNATLTSAHVEELASAIALGESVGLNRTSLDAARHIYEKQAESALKRKDLRHAETLVGSAHSAQASVPSELIIWVKMLKRIRDARKVDHNNDMLPTMLNMVTEAKAMGLPNNTDLTALERKVQAWTSALLKNTSTSNMSRSEFDELLVKVEHVREGGGSSSALADASSKVLQYAQSELKQAVAGPVKSYRAARLKSAFVDAERAGVSEAERTAARQEVMSAIEKQLKSLTAPSANSSSATAKLDQAFISELSHAFTLAERFGVHDAQMISVRNFYQKQGEIALAEKHLSYATVLVENAGPLKDSLPDTLTAWVKMSKRLKEASKIPDAKKESLPLVLSTLSDANEIGMPNSSDYVNVQKKLHAWVTADVNAAMSEVGNSTNEDSFNTLVAALYQATSAGVPATTFTAASTKANSWAAAELQRACTTKPYDAAKIKGAFHNAERAGVPEATRAKAQYDLAVAVEQRLLAASAASNVTRAKRTKEFVEELANSMWLASRFPVNETATIHAHNFYVEQGMLAYKEQDFHYADLLITSAKRADANLPENLVTWVSVLKQLREAEELPAGRTDQLPALLDMISKAKNLGLHTNKHLAAVEVKAKQMAAADLRAEL